MKIIFLCSSLELGRDGVGDYTRRLAGELIRQGHYAAIIALNDKYLQRVEQNTIQVDEGQEVDVLRLSNQLSWKKRIDKSYSFINSIDPEWLSLQYVPYGFNKKGLPFKLNKRLENLGKGRKWHIMFHELWIGMHNNAKLKDILIGGIQRTLIKKTIVSLNPKVISTQTNLYQIQLLKLGYDAKHLPLFGNILKKKFPSDLFEKDDKITVSIFGTIHPNAPIENFASDLKQYSLNIRKSIKVLFIGRNGKELTHWLTTLNNNEIPTEIAGEKSPEEISYLLQSSTIGISTTPLLLIEKSGTVAAMLEHGLSVVCLQNNWFPRGDIKIAPVSWVKIYKKNEVSLLFESCIFHKYQMINLSNTCNNFIKYLI